MTSAAEHIPYPRPSTHRRNRPLAVWRRARAIELATQGATYEAIAHAVGYADRGTAHRVVKRALESRTIAAIDAYRQLEVDRLDALQAAIWGTATSGDPVAVIAVLRLIDARCRLHGLDAADRIPEMPRAADRTVVISAAPASPRTPR